MSHPRFSVEEIFHRVRQISDLREREAFLHGACGKDLTLRSKVDVLLSADADASSFLVTGSSLDTKFGDRGMGEQVGDTIDRYKLLQEIGEGGFGVVYLAEQRVPMRRRVALKVIKLGMDTKQVLARFDVERQALAMMDHPNIAKVLDGGATKSGRPFFVMELVEGVPITTYCDGAHLTVQERLRLFSQVCAAIQHAHQKGIVHRDIKPSNVMVTLHDGVPVPKVIDFGIAKATAAELTEKTLFTEYGQMIGTPVYMSPEQAEMSGLDIDTRSDIYSLGILLYELLTGTTPFTIDELRAAGFAEMRRFICEREPMRPSTRLSTLEKLATVATQRGVEPKRLGQLMRGDLDWIIMKTLEKNRAQRYATASGLADDLERFLADEPVSASPPSALRRAQKFVRRNRKAVLAGAFGVALSLAGTIGTTWGLIHERAAKEEATEQRGVALEQTRLAEERAQDLEQAYARISEQSERTERASYASILQAAKSALDAGNRREAQRLHELCKESLRGWEWGYVGLNLDQADVTLEGHAGGVVSVSWSPDGTRFASGGQDETVRIWSSEGELLHALSGFRAPVNLVQWSPKGKRLLTASQRGSLQVWDPATGEELHKLHAWGPNMFVAAWSPDGSKIISGSGDSRMRVWDADSGVCLQDARWPDSKTPRAIAWSPDGEHMAGVSEYGRLQVWDMLEGVKLGEPEQVYLAADAENPDDFATIVSVSWSQDGKRLFMTGEDGELGIRDLAIGTVQVVRGPGSGSVNVVAWSPDGQKFATGSSDSTLSTWDVASAKRLRDFRGHDGEVLSVAWSADGTQLLTGGEDGTLRIWEADLYRGNPGMGLPAQTDAWSPDGKLLAGMGYLESTDILDAETLEPGWNKDWDGGPYWAWSRDGLSVISLTTYGSVDILDSRSGALLKSVSAGDVEHVYVVQGGLSWSPDDSEIAYVLGGQKPQVVNVESGMTRTLGIGDTRPFSNVAWSPDWSQIATTTTDGSVQVWDSATEHLLMTLDGHRKGVESISWSPDGSKLATGSADHDLRIWDVATGDCLLVMVGHSASVICIGWSPDGSRLASGDESGYLHVWDAVIGLSLIVVERPAREADSWDYPASFNSVSWSPDGTRIFAAGDYESVILESRLESAKGIWRANEIRRVARVQSAWANRFVQELFDRHAFLEPVLEVIRQDPSLSDEQRALALQHAEAEGAPPAWQLNELASDLVAPYRGDMDTDVIWGLELARAAVALEPKDSDYLDTLAWALFENGFLTEAVESLETAIELAPEEEASDYLESLEQLRRALGGSPVLEEPIMPWDD